MKALVTVALVARSAALSLFFFDALEMSVLKGYQVSKQDVDKAYH